MVIRRHVTHAHITGRRAQNLREEAADAHAATGIRRGNRGSGIRGGNRGIHKRTDANSSTCSGPIKRSVFPPYDMRSRPMTRHRKKSSVLA